MLRPAPCPLMTVSGPAALPGFRMEIKIRTGWDNLVPDLELRLGAFKRTVGHWPMTWPAVPGWVWTLL